jgi:FAD/FMN-containing dehydrogenase
LHRVGIAGHALHGGFGLSSHTHGLALDWIVGLNVVLANGTLVHCSAEENPDLFWGMLGAGSNFAVVTSFEMSTFAPPANLTWFVANLPLKKENAVAGLEALQDYTLHTMPAELNMRVVGTQRNTQLEGIYYGNKTELQAALAPLLNRTGGNILQSGTTDWPGSLQHFATMSLNQTHPHNEVCPLVSLKCWVQYLLK